MNEDKRTAEEDRVDKDAASHSAEEAAALLADVSMPVNIDDDEED